MRKFIRHLHIMTALMLCSLTITTSCVEQAESPQEHIHQHTKQSAIRPTEGGDGPFGEGYGEVEVKSFASPKGHVRVWWAVSGNERPPSTDANANQVPDFVETVATVGDDVLERLIASGWKTAVSDETFNDGNNGGDARFDIYLRNMTAGDGTFVRERCAPSGCAGFIVIDNDFFGSNYRSLEEAARVLVSHEYFHAVQSAYSVEVEGWVSEGTATWYEEIFHPEQDDFEKLSNVYFKDHKRSLNDRVRGPADGFSYGASLFFHFLSLQYDELLIQEFLGQITFEEPQTTALERALVARGTSVEEMFLHFSVYNLFTGNRATAQFGYPAAKRYDEVSVKALGTYSKFDLNVQHDPLASGYWVFDTTKDVLVTRKATGGRVVPNIALVSAREYPNDGQFKVMSDDGPTLLKAEDAPFYIVSTGGIEAAAATISVRPVPATMPPKDMGMEEDMTEDMPSMEMTPSNDSQDDDGGCQSVPVGRPVAPLALLGFVMLALPWRRRVSRTH